MFFLTLFLLLSFARYKDDPQKTRVVFEEVAHCIHISIALL